MGGGKASIDHWEINVRAGMVLFEFLFLDCLPIIFLNIGLHGFQWRLV